MSAIILTPLTRRKQMRKVQRGSIQVAKRGRKRYYDDYLARCVDILVTFKQTVIKDTFGDLQDQLSDIGQMFSEVIDSVEEADFLSLFKPE